MDEMIFYEQWLQSLPDMNGRWVSRLYEAFPTAQELFERGVGRLEEVLPQGAAGIVRKRMQELGGLEGMARSFWKLKQQGISFVSRRQEGYPARLLDIPDPPLGLYYKGRLPCEAGISVAIIGSRDCSEYGKAVARELGRYLGERGIPVISGMARGVDGISQQAALEAGGTSYGVLGCGVDICYPASNQPLYDQLISQGGILSTYAPGTQPLSKNFPPRNRIVSGLADALVVVEARVKSGTLITVDMALEQAREVYVVPGRVTDRLSDGCNRLLKAGAGVYLDPESFLEELTEQSFLKKMAPAKAGETKACEAGEENIPERKTHMEKREPRENLLLRGLTQIQTEVYKCLEEGPRSPEEIGGMLHNRYTISEISIILMELAMEGLAKQLTAGHFVRGR